MRKIAYISLIILLFLPVVLKGQDIEEKLLNWLETNSRQELTKRLERIKQSYPDSPVPFFLEGYLEEDAEQAISIYREIVRKYPKSQFAERAMLKIAQYNYMTGSYTTAHQYLVKFINKYPDSKWIPQAMYLAAMCSAATKNYKMAEKELKVLIKKHPHSPFKTHARLELKYLIDRSQQDKNMRRMIALPQTPQPEQASEPVKSKGRYTIQVGAFRDRANAVKVKNFYDEEGYSATINSIKVKGTLFYRVWLGSFETKDQARKFGKLMENKYGLPYRVVKK